MKFFLLVSLMVPASVFAGDASLFKNAVDTLQEGIPSVAIEKLQLYLKENPTPLERLEANLQLVAALNSLGKTREARNLLDQFPTNSETQFLRIQSFLTDENWMKVLESVKITPETSSRFYAPTIFARAEARRGLQQNNLADLDYQLIENDPLLGNSARLRRADLATQAAKLSLAADLIKLPQTDDLAALQMATLLSAENHYLKKEYGEAESQFRTLLKNPVNLSARADGSVRLGIARSLFAENRLDEAEDVLEAFIEKRPNDEQLALVFQELNSVYENEKNPSPNQLRHWSRDAAQSQRQALAIYYQSRFDLRDKGAETALSTLANWLQKFPSHPLRASVLLHYGEELLARNKWTDAAQRFREGLALKSERRVTGQLHVALASALFASSNFSQAAEQFQQGADFLVSGTETLLYNTALCWLRAANFEQFLHTYQVLSQTFPESSLRRDLLVEEGFLQARSKQFDAAANTLALFLRDFPGHHRVADAHLALAEIALNNNPIDSTLAENQLSLAAQSTPSTEVAERTAFLQLFVKPETDGSKQLERCLSFLTKFPGSKLEAEIRFKMGELYFASKDYTSAGTQFETISDKFQDSPLLEQARFLAGQSAIRTMNPSAVDSAISLFEEVVRMKGPLQPYARFEQASVKKNSGALDEALILYDDLLNQNPPSDLLANTLAAKGETLYLQGTTKLPEAISTFDTLATLPQVSRYWRNLALYKKGKAQGLLGKKEAMLASFYDVLATPEKNETPETFWFYRAGFEAAEMLESDEQWKAAIAIYKKLVDSQGPRSAEAAQRIDRLRLEHFIWD